MFHIKKYYLLKWIRFDKLILLWEDKKNSRIFKRNSSIISTFIRKYEREEQCER